MPPLPFILALASALKDTDLLKKTQCLLIFETLAQVSPSPGTSALTPRLSQEPLGLPILGFHSQP
jgi:hypothetical protein